MSDHLRETNSNVREPASVVPAGLIVYKRTPDFTEQTIPVGLLRAHSTKDGVWGCIRVLEGQLVYRIADARRETRETLLTADRPGIVEPTVLHYVEPRGPTRFFVEFMRPPNTAQVRKADVRRQTQPRQPAVRE